jgi:hypothetical protein
MVIFNDIFSTIHLLEIPKIDQAFSQIISGYRNFNVKST